MPERNFRHFCHTQRDGGTSRQDTSAGVSLKDTQRLCRPHSNVRDWQAWVLNKAERHPSKEKAARVRTPRSSRLPRSFTEVVLLKGRALKALGYIRPTEVTSVALTHISGAQASRPYDPYAETSTREVSGGRSAPETSYPVDRTRKGKAGDQDRSPLIHRPPHLEARPICSETFKGPLTVPQIY